MGQTAVKRLRTMTCHRTADRARGWCLLTVCCCPAPGLRRALLLETTVDLLILELLALGLLTALNGAFALALPVWVWLGTAMLCPVWLALHRAPTAQRGPPWNDAGAGCGVSVCCLWCSGHFWPVRSSARMP